MIKSRCFPMRSTAESRASVVRFGVFELDTEAGELRKNGHTVRLQEQPRKVLEALLRKPGILISREDLARDIWPEGIFVDYEHGLNAAVARLRQILRDSAEDPRYIETVARKGYRFVAPVDADKPAPPLAQQHSRRWPLVAAIAIFMAILAMAGLLFWKRRERRVEAWGAAQQAYESGINLLRQRTLSSVRESADEFRRAIGLRSNFAAAWAGLAEASALIQPEDVTACVELGERALRMDPQCGECRSTLGFIRFTRQWRWREGGELLSQAAAVLPDDAQAQYWYAQWLIANGQNKAALETIDKAQRRCHNGFNLLALRAGCLYFRRSFDESVAAADKAIALNLASGWHWRAKALFMAHRYPEAIRSLWFDFGTWSSLHSDAISQRAADASVRYRQSGLQAPLEDLLAMTAGPEAATQQAENRARWYMLLGRYDAALESLERGIDARLFDLLWLATDPLYEPLHQRPRFQAMLRRINPEWRSEH